MMEKPQPKQRRLNLEVALKMPEKQEPNENYSLKASTKKIGQLYPVLKAADGEILDGCHRIESDPTWKTMVLENVNTPEEKIIARLVANFHRRTVPHEEKAQWINQLAEIYMNNDLKVEAATKKGNLFKPNEIVKKICEVTGLCEGTVWRYLKPCFKQEAHRLLDPEQHSAYKEPEEIIFNHLKYRRPQWAREVI